jgi:FtsH-binding integral membrane protein
LPFKKRRIPFLNISLFIYKQKRKYELIRLIGIIFIGLVFAWLAGTAEAILTGSTNPILIGGIGILSTFSTHILTTYGERLIKNIDPEDYDLVGRANRK